MTVGGSARHAWCPAQLVRERAVTVSRRGRAPIQGWLEVQEPVEAGQVKLAQLPPGVAIIHLQVIQ